jgi:cell division protease FtsH
MFFTFIAFIYLFGNNPSNCYIFQKTNVLKHIHQKYKTINMFDKNYETQQDIDLLHNSKFLFSKENYNDVINDIIHDKVSKIYIDQSYRQLVTVDNLPKDDILYNHYHLVDIDPITIPNLVAKTGENNIPIHFVNFIPDSIVNIQHLSSQIFSFVSYGIPIYFIILVISNIFRMTQMSKMNQQNPMNKLGQPNRSPFGLPFMPTKEQNINKPNVSLSSWAGSPEVIEECKEVISYVENKNLYKEIGAEMPKGILFEGPPGTGKTLLAKAIASETNSTFMSVSGSEFVELFVGMGAARVRELFSSARQNRPCIIFIDEIDAVGRQRGGSGGFQGSNDEREQTLNQILYEMDGFNDNEDIVVMAATNRKDVLDQALIRPGRFDRIIKIPLPDKDSRQKILEYYFSSKKTDNDFDIGIIAELTDGFSGAELKNLINEAAIISARNNLTMIAGKYIFDAFEKSIVGLIRKNATVNNSTRTRVAIHEAGHSVLTLLFDNYFDFQKASIQPTYNGAGGYTIFSEKPEIKEGGLYTKDIFKKRLIISMGGKAAESLYYGNDFVSLGAIEDLKQANRLAQRMIGNFGMGDKFEVFFNEQISDDSNPFAGRGFGDRYSEKTKFTMDNESLSLVNEAFSEAKRLLGCKTNYDKLINFSNQLLNSTVIMKNDIKNLF